jgi:hypothetical protein
VGEAGGEVGGRWGVGGGRPDRGEAREWEGLFIPYGQKEDFGRVQTLEGSWLAATAIATEAPSLEGKRFLEIPRAPRDP